MGRNCSVYKFADVAVQVKYLFSENTRYFKKYEVQEKPEFKVKVSKKDILAEKRVAPEMNSNLPDWCYEYLAVLRKVGVKISAYDTILFHSSALAVDGQAYLFAAPSGTGKSTHARLWREMLGERVVMINDDKPFIRIVDGKPIVYGSPWNGKHRLDSNIACPLKAICFLEQGRENKIRTLSSIEAFPLLSKQIYFPEERKACERVIQVVGKLSKMPTFKLTCDISEEAARLSFNTMRGEKL